MRATTLACALAGLGLIQVGVAGAAGPGGAPGPAVTPAADPGLGLAGSAAYLSPGAGSLSGDAYGTQVYLTSPWLKLPGGTIGQQLSVNSYNRDGVQLTTAALSPRYLTDVAPGLALGVGPGLGYTWADADFGRSTDLWAVQIGADLDYRQGPLFMGLDARYQWSEDQAAATSAGASDNWLTTLKLGVTF